jgi:chaperonin GroEL (HSP60 family)
MTGKSVGGQIDYLSDLAVKAVKSVAEETDGKAKVDVENIKVEKKTGMTVADTELINGLVVDKEKVHPRMPKMVKNAKIAIISSALEIKKTEVEAKIQIRDPAAMQRFLDEEEAQLKAMVDKIRSVGANVVFCQKGMDDLVQHYLAKANIYACRRLKESDMEKLAKATGGNVVGNLDSITKADLGIADAVEERKIGEEEMTFVTGCKNPKAISIIIRGGTEHVIDEVERSLDDAMSVVAVAIEDGKIVTGGGSTAVELAMRLREYAASVGGREQIAIDAYASALEVIPTALAENAGLDPIDILINMRKAHKGGNAHAGLNVYTGKIVDMMDQKVIEPIRVDRQAINSATDAAVLILRIDDVIAARGGAPGGMPGGAPDMGGDED